MDDSNPPIDKEAEIRKQKLIEERQKLISELAEVKSNREEKKRCKATMTPLDKLRKHNGIEESWGQLLSKIEFADKVLNAHP